VQIKALITTIILSFAISINNMYPVVVKIPENILFLLILHNFATTFYVDN